MNETVLTRVNVKAFAQHLGGEVVSYESEHGYTRANITTKAGLPLHVSYTDYTKRIAISVNWPTFKESTGTHRTVTARDVVGYRESTPTIDITCAPDRGGNAIAKDIARRLIPHALPVYLAAVARCKEHEKAANARIATRDELNKALGLESRGRDEFRLYPGGLTLEVSAGDSVCIDRVYVTPATALKIVELVKAEKGGE